MEGQQFESSLIKNLPKSGVFSVPTPIEEMNPVVLVKYDGIGEEKKLKCFLWKFWTIRILMQKRKAMIVQVNNRVQVFCSRMTFRWRKSNCWWLRSKNLKIERNQNGKQFLEYFEYHNFDAWIKTKIISIELSPREESVRCRLCLEES